MLSAGLGDVETFKTADMSCDHKATPTPGQLLVIESNSFTADKFVSKRSSKKWDVPPSEVMKKNSKSFDATTVDPSEFVPKVVPMCEVESAMGREGEEEVGGGGEEGSRVVSIRQTPGNSTSEVCVCLCSAYSSPMLYILPSTACCGKQK